MLAKKAVDLGFDGKKNTLLVAHAQMQYKLNEANANIARLKQEVDARMQGEYCLVIFVNRLR